MSQERLIYEMLFIQEKTLTEHSIWLNQSITI